MSMQTVRTLKKGFLPSVELEEVLGGFRGGL